MSNWGFVRNLLLLAVLSVFFVGCSAASHKAAVQDTTSDKLTVGKVQREIKKGMSSADVAQVLGSPNIVSTDSEGREVWIYDKVSTENVYSESSVGASILILGGSGASGASSKTQRTLTIIIKYGKDHLVREFAYNQSSF